MILETLKFLGELDDSAMKHHAVVVDEIRQSLARPAERDSQVVAWEIYSAQFDHLYSQTYYETVDNLMDDDRKKLLKMAANGASGNSIFIACLICDLVSFGDKNVGKEIARWTVLPRADDLVMPDKAIQNYVTAHIALAKLCFPLPENRNQDSNSAARSLKACGAILYWINRIDLCDSEILSNCKSELQTLEKEGRFSAIDVICECEQAIKEFPTKILGDQVVIHSIVHKFTKEVAAISRDALRNPQSLVAFFKKFSKSKMKGNLLFAINVLKHYGSDEDQSLLRRYATIKDFGKQALEALKVIQERQLTQ